MTEPAVTEPAAQPAETGTAAPETGITVPASAELAGEPLPQGWGYYLKNYFSSNVTVDNRAIAGRSSKSFYDNGRLTSILNQIKPGDYLLIDFGINDDSAANAERYAPVCGNVDNPKTGSFEYYMTFYIKGALDKGATPILMSPTLSIKNQMQPFKAGYRHIDAVCQSLSKEVK